MNVESISPAVETKEMERVTHVKRAIELDFLRGIAILLVLTAHFTPGLYAYFHLGDFGWAGVDLFFVLSGFLVGGLLLREWRKTGKVDGLRFLKRRAFKIWPAYYFYILLVWVLHEHPWREFLVGNLLNIQNYVGTVLHHTWSLAVEEHFYLLLTVFLLIASRRQMPIKRVLIICLLTSVAVTVTRTVAIALQHWNAVIETHTRMDALLYGVALAILFNFYPDRFSALQQRKFFLWATFFGCLAMVATRNYIGLPYHPEFFFADVAAAALLLLTFRPVTNPKHNFLYRVLALIGVYSYGIYLWHLAGLKIAKALGGHLRISGPWLLDVVPYFTSILLGVIMTKLIEFPFLRIRERVVPSPHGSHLLSKPAEPVSQRD